MLVEYIQAAMNQAIIVLETADGTCRGDIPGFVGVCATGTTEDDCRANLQTVLEEWVVFRVSRGLELPNISSATPSIPRSEINDQRLERISKLEKDLEELRLELGGIRKPKTFWNQANRFNEWYKNYFSLLSVVIGAIAVGVGFWLYRVNPIQKYQDNLTKEVATDNYRDLGDRFMNYGEFDKAAVVYKNALDVDKYDVRANSGLRTAEIFQLLARLSDPVAIDVRISALRQNLEGKPEYAYLLLVEGINLRRHRDCSGAQTRFEQAIVQKSSFVGGYNQLATTQLRIDSVDIATVTENFEKARRNDPDQTRIYAPTLRDLGYCHLIQGYPDDAIQLLEEAYNRLQRAEISIKLGDAYRAKGNLERAIYFHQLTVDGVERVPKENEIDYLGNATFVFLPGRASQKKAFVMIATKDQYKTLALYALSFDHALKAESDQKANRPDEVARDLVEASRRFDEAFKLDPNYLYSEYATQALKAIRGSVSTTAAGWLDERLKQLTSVKPVDDRVSKMCDR